MTPLKLCKCLADETRMKIVMSVRQHGELCVCDLVDTLGQPQSTVSRHLAQLRECGLLSVRKDAQWAWYRLHEGLPMWVQEVLDAMQAPALKQLSLKPDQRSGCC
ncbi:MAG: metalloregulator ArsR/SmtB family transcription factor [Alcanivoracaceae bacterium]|jgi:ArsR family transcriptional regulator|nr:metalloregulator ArsR/SmtB family transcription factor [Alcanivoracaceae bacterium]